MFKTKKALFNVTIPRTVLESIYDECDQFDVDETGGRIVGTYEQRAGKYEIKVLGVLGPGPKAKRSPTSFFQDGEYQEKIFRALEEKHPQLEHLGNWHTHHVNGLQTLSGGDRTTYRATVDHDKHNTDFFYALLVVRKTMHKDRRYQIKHYFFRRNDETIYEIPDDDVQILNVPALWSRSSEASSYSPAVLNRSTDVAVANKLNVERPKDEEFFSNFYSSLRPLFSQSLEAFYWKGKLDLIDGSHVEILVMETGHNGAASYSITVSGRNKDNAQFASEVMNRTFKSARHAVISLERDLNRALYNAKKKEK